MSSRDRNLIIGLVAVILLGGGAVAGYVFVYTPLEEANTTIAQLNDEIDGTQDKKGLSDKADTMRKAVKLVAITKQQSLPKSVDIAKTQYKLLLEQLLRQAKITDFRFPDAKTLDNRAPATPELAPKKAAYTRLGFVIDIKKTDIWQLTDFLYQFYELDLLHQITELSIVRENKVTDMRNGLAVKMSIEAIILDGAEDRQSMFPVSFAGKLTWSGEAVAAIGGGRAVQAVAVQPELVRRVTSLTNAPVLAALNRDYSLIPLRDIFYGILPADKPASALAFAKISDTFVRYGLSEPLPEVKISLTGDGAETAKITAKASGSFIPDGPLTIDPKTHTISFPPVNEEASMTDTSTVSVVATSETGKEVKTSFKVGYMPYISKKDDISSAIRLIMVVGSSEGIVTATIQDNFNPFKYKISTTYGPGKEISVTKSYLLIEKSGRWSEDNSNDNGILTLSDNTSSTKRTLKIIAIEDNGLIVADWNKPDAKVEQKGKGNRPGGGMGGGGGMGAPRDRDAGDAAKGPADPLAVVVGSAATLYPTQTIHLFRIPVSCRIQYPVLYRWVNGKSLKELDKSKLSIAETVNVLQRVARHGAADMLMPISK